jgi:stage III sporulation protein SpoIIIAA
MSTHIRIDDLHLLEAVLPPALQTALAELPRLELLEIVMDLGRPAEARLAGRAVRLSEAPVTHDDLDYVVGRVGEFNADNRTGIEGTLHRISALRNRKGRIVGLTLRVGRAVFGTIDEIRSLVEEGMSLLLLGRPGVGKTTRLREVARVLADDLGKRVIVIDTSNEIGGDGDIPHPAIGSARRMQVPRPDRQHAVMIEAVENHMPEVIIVDEIGTAEEAVAARTIAERGVQLIGTAHGNTLENLVHNPTLADLVGGVQAVTLGDDEARLRGTQKTVLERKGPPTFPVVVEIASREQLNVHVDAAEAVDDLLRAASGERRRGSRHELNPPRQARAPLAVAAAGAVPDAARPQVRAASPTPSQLRIYPYAVSRDSVERVIRDLGVNARTVRQPEHADIIIALRARAGDTRLRHAATDSGATVHLIKKNTTAQLRRLLQHAFNIVHGVAPEEVEEAVHEAEAGAKRVLNEGVVVELQPRSPLLRKLQHRVVIDFKLMAESVGSEPRRHLVIHPD